MKKWKFVYPSASGKDVQEILTEQQIFERYWTYWYNQIYDSKRENNPNVAYIKTLPLALQRQRCIDEYISVNWGWEVKDDS